MGGGHNGLTTAAYLAHSGLDVVVLERRPILGGACVTEEVWPGARVSRASYVVSMLQPKIVSDLRLHDFGYRAVPLDPAYAAMTPDGPIFFFNEPEQTAASIGAHSRKDGEVYADFEDLFERTADFLRPMLLREPPALGSRNPLDIAALLREGGRAAGLSQRDVHNLVRIFTMSVGDLLDDWFEHDAVKGSIASSGVVGVWAGPRTPGTAYNLLHHALGELDGMPGVWGQVIGGMGAISQAIARSAESAGADDPHRRRGGLHRHSRWANRGRHPRERRGDSRSHRRLRSSSEDDDPRPRRWRELPARDRRGHAPLPDAWRLGEGQHGALRAAPV